MTELSSTFLKQKAFYEQYYVYLRTPNLLLPDTPRIVLGDQGHRRCRFCGNLNPMYTLNGKPMQFQNV